KSRVDTVRLTKVRRRHAVISPEQDSYHQEECKLKQDQDAAGNQRRHRLALAARGQQTLHDELIGTVAGNGKKGPADYAGPEGIGKPQAWGEVEDLKLPGVRSSGMNGAPSSRNKMQDRPQPS